MTGMIPDAKEAPDDLGDAHERPEVGGVAGRQGAPLSSTRSSLARWARESLGGRPGAGRSCNAWSPFLRYIPAHRKTKLTDALTARATGDRLLPAFSSWIACRRRRSNCVAVPGGSCLGV